MSNDTHVVYAVPTHLREREPFAFGRTVGEVAKLVAIGFVAAQVLGQDDLPTAVRWPAAVAVLVIGALWALVRIQHRPLEEWVGLAFRYGATPRRRVWRAGDADLALSLEAGADQTRRSWYELDRVRVRWNPSESSVVEKPVART
ncbi:MAG: hypothetical protein JO352_26010 [Chloroflexi bacterium]|nr:hypothetical protein [Chloroflexota bacterium]MBV9599512.1 hypothetical protein [Chloroflexota bacterium]